MQSLQRMARLVHCLPRITSSLKLVLPEFRASTCLSMPIASNRRLSSSTKHVNTNHHVAIVGGGPAGYYTAQQLLKTDPNVVVDIYEKLPVPYGLVRFGVAPDHPEVKNVINTFAKTAQSQRCNFLGNIEVGQDVTLQELREAYTAVVLCYGASDDKLLGIPGETLQNVLSARSFVGWYNGLPQDVDLPVNLDCEAAVVLGHGNVAFDVARILLTPVSILEKTDISEHALNTLRSSRIKHVHVVGRRGPLQVAFTIKELREMLRLPDTRTIIRPSDVQHIGDVINDLPRSRRRLTELMYKSGVSPTDSDKKLWAGASREWYLTFLRTPLQVLGDDRGHVKGIELAVNKLEGDSIEDQKAVLTEEKEVINCGLVLRSIGYHGVSLDSNLPFDTRKGVIDNENSRVKDQKGLYCTGWIGSGPVGVILGTMTNAFETGKTVASDVQSGTLEVKDQDQRNNVVQRLQSKVVSFGEWQKIDVAETTQGEKIGKPREKMTDIEQMMKVAKS